MRTATLHSPHPHSKRIAALAERPRKHGCQRFRILHLILSALHLLASCMHLLRLRAAALVALHNSHACQHYAGTSSNPSTGRQEFCITTPLSPVSRRVVLVHVHVIAARARLATQRRVDMQRGMRGPSRPTWARDTHGAAPSNTSRRLQEIKSK